MVDSINNLANQIFAKYDAMDTNGSDNKIEASIWNKFVSDKGGKEISNYISKESAIKSIVHYLTNMSKKMGCTVEELANQWLGKSEANPSEISGEKSKLNSNSVDVPAMNVKIAGDHITETDEKNFSNDMNEAVQLVSDIANGRYKYSVQTEKYSNTQSFKTIKLKDGRSIEIELLKDSQGKDKLNTLRINIGNTNYNGDKRYVQFEGSHGNERLCFSDGRCVGNVSEKDFQDLLKAISGILGEDVEV